MPPPDETSTELTSVVWEALAKRLRTLSTDLGISPGVVDELTATFQPVASASDPIRMARQLFQEQTSRARQVLRLIEGLEAEVEVQARRRASLARFTEDWWETQRSAALDPTNPEAAGLAWLLAWVDAILAGEYSAAQRWGELELPGPVAKHVPLGRCRWIARALAADGFAKVPPALVALASTALYAQAMGAVRRAELFTFAARIQWVDCNDPAGALGWLQTAAELAGNHPAVNAAWSEYHLRLQQPDAAAQYGQAAIQNDPDAPDGFAALGAWAESQQRWAEAQEHYDRVGKLLREYPRPWCTLQRLRASISGLLALRVARRLAQHHRLELTQGERLKTAVEGLDLAIKLGVSGESSHLAVEACELKAQLLTASKRPAAEIAEVLYEAGKLRYWRQELPWAMERLREAIALDPHRPGPHWYLADALLMASYLQQPPYVDAARVAEAAGEWEATARRFALDRDLFWPYVTGALVSGQQALLPGAKKTELWWQAVSRLECAVLLGPSDSQSWAYLGRFFGYLLMEANALQVTARALEISPGTALVLTQRATILADTGRFAEAEAVIDERLKSEPNALWEQGVKAFIWLYEHRFAEALNLINSVIEQAPDDPWYRDVRALCARGAGQEELAQADYAWLVEKWKTTAPPPDVSMGWAAMNAGDLHAGYEILDAVCRDEATSNSISLALRGLAALALNQPDQAAADLEAGAVAAINLREIQFILEFGLPWAERESASWPHGEAVHQVIERARLGFKARREQIEAAPPSPEAELQRVLETVPTADGVASWAWVGAHAALARLHLDRGDALHRAARREEAAPADITTNLRAAQRQWSDAARIYAALWPARDRFPQAARGLNDALNRLREVGDHLWRERQPGPAAAAWNEALALVVEEVPGSAFWRAEVLARLVLASLVREGPAAIPRSSRQALEVAFGTGETGGSTRLAELFGSLLRASADYWLVMDLWRGWAEDPGATAGSRALWSSACDSLRPALDTVCRLAPAERRLPMVTPILVEIGADLVPLVDRPDSRLLTELIPTMRDRLRQAVGWQSPGVRFRPGGTGFPANAYQIALDEVPAVAGRLPNHARYVPASAQQLRAFGMDEDAFTEAADPTDAAGRRTGCWVTEASVDLLKAHGLEAWPYREDYLVAHLETLLQDSAAGFVGAQEVADLIAQWTRDEKWGALAARFQAAPPLRMRLRQVLRALLAERVAITRWPVILQAVDGFEFESEDILPLLCETRRRLWDQLPGNEPGAIRVTLDPRQEQALGPCLRLADGRWFFAISWEQQTAFLSEVAEMVTQHGARFTLVIADPKLRFFVRRMIQLRFPAVMTLAGSEVEDPKAVKRMAPPVGSPSSQDAADARSTVGPTLPKINLT